MTIINGMPRESDTRQRIKMQRYTGTVASGLVHATVVLNYFNQKFMSTHVIRVTYTSSI